MNCYEFWAYALEVMMEQERQGIASNEGIAWELIDDVL